MANYDLIVIGGGPAGYVGAIKAAQLGKKVACIEKERAGGTCLNWGCIPTKSLLRNAELYHLMAHRAEEFGFAFEKLTFDWSKIVKRSRDVADKNAGGIEYLFKKHKIDYIRGEAAIEKPGAVKVKLADGKEEAHSAPKMLVATGVVPRALPGLAYDGKRVISSREAMILEKQPKSMIIIGAGAIGIEFAYFYNAFGTKVTVVEMMPNILPVEDTEVSQPLERSFAKQGIKCLTNTKTTKAETTENGVKITVADAKGVEQVLDAEICLVAIGVQPLLPGGTKLELTERGYIKTNDRYETSVPGVCAAGDIIGPPWLAHVASFEALQAVEGMFVNGYKPKKVTIFPGCTYCHPQVASVGLTEARAKELKRDIRVGRFPFVGNGKAIALGEDQGMVKVIFDRQTGALLGAHMVGAEVTELIQGYVVAMNLETTEEELMHTIFPHPTISETMKEAVLDAYGRVLNM